MSKKNKHGNALTADSISNLNLKKEIVCRCFFNSISDPNVSVAELDKLLSDLGKVEAAISIKRAEEIMDTNAYFRLGLEKFGKNWLAEKMLNNGNNVPRNPAPQSANTPVWDDELDDDDDDFDDWDNVSVDKKNSFGEAPETRNKEQLEEYADGVELDKLFKRVEADEIENEELVFNEEEEKHLNAMADILNSKKHSEEKNEKETEKQEVKNGKRNNRKKT